MITVEAKRLGARVIATVKAGISTGRYTYTVQFADQEVTPQMRQKHSESCVKLLK
jgi:hypothetical protein